MKPTTSSRRRLVCCITVASLRKQCVTFAMHRHGELHPPCYVAVQWVWAASTIQSSIAKGGLLDSVTVQAFQSLAWNCGNQCPTPPAAAAAVCQSKTGASACESAPGCAWSPSCGGTTLNATLGCACKCYQLVTILWRRYKCHV